MAHIRKTDSGSYEAFIDMGKDPSTGKRKQFTKTFKQKNEAKLWAAKKIHERENGIVTDPNNYTVREYLLQWLKDYAELNLSPTTYDGYSMIINTHLIPALGQLKLKNLKPMHIQSYQSKKIRSGRKDGQEGGLSKKTLLQHHRVLSKALKQAVQWQLINYNPAQAVPAPSPEKPEINTLTKEEIDTLLDASNGKWIYNFIFVAVYTGMRRGELLGLRWKDINFNDKKIYIRQTLVTKSGEGKVFKKPKTKTSVRQIDISDRVIEVLKKVKKEQVEYRLLFGPDYNENLNLVFCNETGYPFSPDTPGRRFKRIAQKINLDNYTLHDLRHSHATLMLKAGVHPKIVQERLGHSSINITLDTYSHVIPSMQKESVDKFDNVME
ncbi:MAG: tyrosine-type recombinase/integrase [Candidatus Woesearchaeota archaeon]